MDDKRGKTSGPVFRWTMAIAKSRIIAATGLALCLLFQPAAAGPNLCIEGPSKVRGKATAAYQRGEYATAYSLFRSQARDGNAFARMKLGIMYRMGYGVAQDYSRAVYWWSASADQGNANAQCNLGVMFLYGIAVPKDAVLAHMWFNLAASQGHRDARAKRDMVAVWRVSGTELLDAQQLASEWLATHRRMRHVSRTRLD